MPSDVFRPDAGQQSFDEAPCCSDGGSEVARFDEFARGEELVRRYAESPASSPANDWLARQMGETEPDLPFESPKQPMNVTSDNIAAIPNMPRLVPGEERSERRSLWKGAGVESGR